MNQGYVSIYLDLYISNSMIYMIDKSHHQLKNILHLLNEFSGN